jgi:trk system potassium uptake protein TrkA
MVILGKGNAELIDIPVENKKVIGKKIGELSPTKDYIICAVYKGPENEIIIPEPDMVLEEGNKISILIKTKAIKEVIKKFVK